LLAMNMIKKFAYYTAQILCIFPLAFAVIRYKNVHDYDSYYDRLCNRLDWFLT